MWYVSTMEYHELPLEQVQLLAEAGHSDAFMANFFGVPEPTWRYWAANKPSFHAKLDAWKRTADERVVNALYRKACGYTYEVDRYVENKKTGQVFNYKETVHVGADFQAAKYWLSCRRPDEWTERRVVENTGEVKMDHTVRVQQDDLDSRILGITTGHRSGPRFDTSLLDDREPVDLDEALR